MNAAQSDVDEVGRSRDAILSMNADIVIGRTCEKRGCVKENRSKKEGGAKNHKKTVDNTSTYK